MRDTTGILVITCVNGDAEVHHRLELISLSQVALAHMIQTIAENCKLLHVYMLLIETCEEENSYNEVGSICFINGQSLTTVILAFTAH